MFDNLPLQDCEKQIDERDQQDPFRAVQVVFPFVHLWLVVIGALFALLGRPRPQSMHHLNSARRQFQDWYESLCAHDHEQLPPLEFHLGGLKPTLRRNLRVQSRRLTPFPYPY